MNLSLIYMKGFHVNQTHFHIKCFARALFLTQRQKVTRKWSMVQLPGHPFHSLFVHRYEGKNRFQKMSTLERVSEMMRFGRECMTTL